jgi:hypothetical protein
MKGGYAENIEEEGFCLYAFSLISALFGVVDLLKRLRRKGFARHQKATAFQSLRGI